MIRFIKRGRNSRKNFLYADTLICLRIFQYILLIQKADLVLDVHRIHHVFCFNKAGHSIRKKCIFLDTLICLRIFQYILLIQKADLVLDVHRIHHVFCFNKAGHSIRKKCIFLHFFLRISVIFCTFSKSIVSAKGHLKKLQLFFFS